MRLNLLATALAVQSAWAVVVNPLPAPRNISWGDSGEIQVNEWLYLEAPHSHILHKAFERTIGTIRKTKYYPTAIEKPAKYYVPIEAYARDNQNERRGPHKIKGVKVNINNVENEDLGLDVDESYEINVKKDSKFIEVTAETVWGALHAFSTLQQILIYKDHKLVIEQPVSIKDEPLYPHRGVMLDTGRNFLSVDKILKQLDGMALSKLNVLHWHIEDSQSWPLFIRSFPQMIDDAYGQNMVYRPHDIRRVVQYAHERGIRVIPELDMPGHCNSGWEQIDPNITTCTGTWYGQLDPANPDTYDAVEKVYNDASELFQDDFFHVGLDEVSPICWNSSAHVQKWFKEDSARDWNALLQHWVDSTIEFFKNPPSMKNKDGSNRRRLMMWEDVVTADIHAKVPSDVVMQIWEGSTDAIKNVTKLGHDVIISTQSFFYLNCGVGTFIGNDPRYDVFEDSDPSGKEVNFNYNGNAGSPCGPYKNYQRIYAYDFHRNLTDEEHEHILGGEVTAWAELIDDHNIEQTLWPRAGAFGELLWSGNKDENGNYRVFELTQRLYNFRDYMSALGFAAVPIGPRFCLQNPHSCDITKNATLGYGSGAVTGF